MIRQQRRKFLLLPLALGACERPPQASGSPEPHRASHRGALQPAVPEPSDPELPPEVAVEPPKASLLAGRPIRIVPLGAEMGEEAIAAVAKAIAWYFSAELMVSERLPLPAGAYYPERKRYRAEKLLDYLSKLDGSDLRRIGLTARDISTTKGQHADWGILGLADLPGSSCVISSFRTQQGKSGARAIERLQKTAIHELGHTFGLTHCPSPGCLMQDGQGTVVTTDSETDFCERCHGILREQGVTTDQGPFPWNRVSDQLP